MDKDFIAQRLYDYARWYAASRGYRFGQGSDSDIRNLTATAANNILARSYAPHEQDLLAAQVRLAEAQAAYFVDHMIHHWHQDKSLQSANIIGEKTFEWAKNLLCPFPPFC